MEAYEILAGDIIFSEGDPGEFAAFIRSGRVQILKHTPHGEVELAILGANDVFGEMALFEPQDVRSATARALDHVIVDVLSAQEMQALVDDSPEMLQPFIRALVSRLRENNRRLAEKERATVLLGHNINHIHVSGMGVLENQISLLQIETANLPLTIGGYDNTNPPPHANNLEIPCDPSSMNVSFEHCAIEHHEDGVYIVDRGSRYRTIVNDKSIGRGEVTGKALLMPGDNHIILGAIDKGMQLLIKCE